MAKAGKWAFLKGKYPRVPVDADYMQKLDAVLDSPAPASIVEEMPLTIRMLADDQLKAVYLLARDRADLLNAELSVLNLEIEAYTRLFVDRFEEGGEASKTFEDGVSIGVGVEPYANVSDQAAMMKWLKDTGQESLLTLNFQTMTSLVKERLEGKVNEPLPPGISVFMKDRLTCRGRKKASTTNEE